MLPHAPGVQMADIPADGVAIKEDVDDADPDKRNPQQVSEINYTVGPSGHIIRLG